MLYMFSVADIYTMPALRMLGYAPSATVNHLSLIVNMQHRLHSRNGPSASNNSVSPERNPFNDVSHSLGSLWQQYNRLYQQGFNGSPGVIYPEECRTNTNTVSVLPQTAQVSSENNLRGFNFVPGSNSALDLYRNWTLLSEINSSQSCTDTGQTFYSRLSNFLTAPIQSLYQSSNRSFGSSASSSNPANGREGYGHLSSTNGIQTSPKRRKNLPGENDSENQMDKRLRTSSFRGRDNGVYRDFGRAAHNQRGFSTKQYNEVFRRRWSKVADAPKGLSHDKLEFSLMCYNILAQNLLLDNRYLYRYCDERYLEWEFRKSNLLTEILDSKTDIICLQEVQRQHFENYFMPEMNKKGFIGVYKQRTGNKHDGCAIFYNKYKFKAAAVKPVTFRRRGSYLLDRDNVGLVILLQTRTGPTSHKLCVGTTHLLFNPKRGDIKLCQLAMLLAEMDQMSKYNDNGQMKSCPVILCGDMNSSIVSPLVQFLKDGRLDLTSLLAGDIAGQSEGQRGMKRVLDKPPWPSFLGINENCRYKSMTEWVEGAGENTSQDNSQRNGKSSSQGSRNIITHPFNFSSVYSLARTNPEVTSNHAKTNSMLDYIFYSSPRSEDGRLPHLLVNARYDLLSASQAEALGGLPCQVFSSDHFSLAAKFTLTR